MRVGVVSDTHGMIGRLSTVLMEMESGGPLDVIIHLGDGYWDLRDLDVPLPLVYQVAGNCDHFQDDTFASISLSRVNFVLTHGHQQHVKGGTDALYQVALEHHAQIALYGHTHVQKMEWRDGILLLNPGSVMHGNAAVIQIDWQGKFDVQLLGE